MIESKSEWRMCFVWDVWAWAGCFKINTNIQHWCESLTDRWLWCLVIGNDASINTPRPSKLAITKDRTNNSPQIWSNHYCQTETKSIPFSFPQPFSFRNRTPGSKCISHPSSTRFPYCLRSINSFHKITSITQRKATPGAVNWIQLVARKICKLIYDLREKSRNLRIRSSVTGNSHVRPAKWTMSSRIINLFKILFQTATFLGLLRGKKRVAGVAD